MVSARNVAWRSASGDWRPSRSQSSVSSVSRKKSCWKKSSEKKIATSCCSVRDRSAFSRISVPYHDSCYVPFVKRGSCSVRTLDILVAYERGCDETNQSSRSNLSERRVGFHRHGGNCQA